MNGNPLQAVFIDWYLTLSQSVFWEPLAIEDNRRYQSLRKSLFVTRRGYHAAWMRGAWTTEQIMDWVAQDTGLSYAFVLAEFVRSCQTMTFMAPEALGLVAALRRRGVRVVIATDNMDSFSRFTVPALGLSEMFDDILNSFELNVLKGDCDAGGRSLFFQPYLLAQGLSTEQCVLIDDAQPTPEYCGQMGLG